MARFETSNELGMKEFIMDELRLTCNLALSEEIRNNIRQHVNKEVRYLETLNLPNDYGSFLTYIKDYIKITTHGPSFITPLIHHTIDTINENPKNDYIIKHITYVLKQGVATADTVFNFLHVIEFIIEQRRLRLL